MDEHQPGIGVEHQPTDVPDESRWHPLTFRERLRILPVVQDVWFAATYWTGIRDRMRCPKCRAVGTWKMHGSLIERWMGDIAVRRWLCKWCGHYIGLRGRTVAYPSTKTHVWTLPETGGEREVTPSEALRASLGTVWPWFG